MKPYAKTFRVYKDHKAKDCALCAEQVGQSPSPMRREARKQINNDVLNSDLENNMATFKTAITATLPISYDIEVDYTIDPGDDGVGLPAQLHIDGLGVTPILSGQIRLQECEIDEDEMERIKAKIWESLNEEATRY